MITTAPSPDTIMRTGLAPAPNIPNPRNAGRKKSNPVWEFFTDLRSHGLAGVRCRFCHWVTNDRSPTTMKFHLKRKHDTGPGGLWAICEEKINSQAPANYAPRTKKVPEDMLMKALTSTQSPFQFNPFATAEIKLGAQDDFLAALIQQASQYANSSTSPSANSNEGNASNENESLTMTDSVFLSKLSSNTFNNQKEEDSSSSSVSGITTGSEFQLNDGSSIATLLQIASDSDLSFTFNARKNGEYCFEANPKNHKMVTLTDCGNEIRVTQLENEEEIRVEMWRKSDWQQFTWAVRGTCLHFLKNCSKLSNDDDNDNEIDNHMKTVIKTECII